MVLPTKNWSETMNIEKQLILTKFRCKWAPFTLCSTWTRCREGTQLMEGQSETCLSSRAPSLIRFPSSMREVSIMEVALNMARYAINSWTQSRINANSYFVNLARSNLKMRSWVTQKCRLTQDILTQNLLIMQLSTNWTVSTAATVLRQWETSLGKSQRT